MTETNACPLSSGKSSFLAFILSILSIICSFNQLTQQTLIHFLFYSRRSAWLWDKVVPLRNSLSDLLPTHCFLMLFWLSAFLFPSFLPFTFTFSLLSLSPLVLPSLIKLPTLNKKGHHTEIRSLVFCLFLLTIKSTRNKTKLSELWGHCT